MGDSSTNRHGQEGTTGDSRSISTSPAPAHPSHKPQASAGEVAADARQIPRQDFNPAAYPHQPNQPGYHMQSQYAQPDPYGMSGMRQALPDYSAPAPYGFQQYPGQPAPGPPVVYPLHHGQYPQNASYAPPTAFGSPYPPQYGQRSPVATQFDQNAMPYQYYQDAYGRPSGSPTIYMQQVAQFYQPAMQAGPPSSAAGQARGARGPPGGLSNGSETKAAESLNSAPRGPPRKPKQSGHALWVGNLPSNTTVSELKDHFSKDATRDIASVFLISKSNCAFVNYRTEEACDAALLRFNESLFKGLRLVCRQRKSANPDVGAPSGPSSVTGQRDAGKSERRGSAADDVEDKPNADPTETTTPRIQRSKDRFFIVKSLTVQDLEQSVRNGIWATQMHNEAALTEAYESAENVYLIFSANKSGEYFGFARMASPIAENAAEGAMPRTNATYAGDAPKTIPTHATAFAPKGLITDDSARGTIFWEAQLSDDEADEDAHDADDQAQDESETWGKPFKVEWISTNRLPFYKTRGLRNAWNSNREVKIARDGTELEPGVGRQLLELMRSPPHSSR